MIHYFQKQLIVSTYCRSQENYTKILLKTGKQEQTLPTYLTTWLKMSITRFQGLNTSFCGCGFSFTTLAILVPKIYFKQEYIPGGCIPSAAVAVSPAMHAPCHACPPCHARPLPHMPPCHACSPSATHAFCHGPPTPTMHAPPCHACPLALPCIPLPHMPPPEVNG